MKSSVSPVLLFVCSETVEGLASILQGNVCHFDKLILAKA